MDQTLRKVVAGLFSLVLGWAGVLAAGTWEDPVWRFPISVSVVLMLLGGVVLFRSVLGVARSRGRQQDSNAQEPVVEVADSSVDEPVWSDGALAHRRVALEVGVVVCAVSLAIVLMFSVGFLITALVLVALLAFFLSRDLEPRPVIGIVLFTVGLVGSVYLLFVELLNVNLPG